MEEQLADLIHEARCGPEEWKSSEHIPWTDDHREWDLATARALLMLGVWPPKLVEQVKASIEALPLLPVQRINPEADAYVIWGSAAVTTKGRAVEIINRSKGDS